LISDTKTQTGIKNIAQRFHGNSSFSAENLKTTLFRPYISANCWIADISDKNPWIELKWTEAQNINKIRLFFDVDYDHPMESAHRLQPESIMPFCVRKFRIKDSQGNLLCDVSNNYQGLFELSFDQTKKLTSVRIELEKPADNVPVALFGIVCM
jgi:hypothetical protein